MIKLFFWNHSLMRIHITHHTYNIALTKKIVWIFFYWGNSPVAWPYQHPSNRQPPDGETTRRWIHPFWFPEHARNKHWHRVWNSNRNQPNAHTGHRYTRTIGNKQTMDNNQQVEIRLHDGCSICRSPDSWYAYKYASSILGMDRPYPAQSPALANTT